MAHWTNSFHRHAGITSYIWTRWPNKLHMDMLAYQVESYIWPTGLTVFIDMLV